MFDPISDDATENIINFGIFFGLLGAAVGGITGAVGGKDKTIQIQGKSESEIQKIMEELRKKARVPEFQ